MTPGLGRREPTDWKHVDKHPLKVGAPLGFTVEKKFLFPGTGYRPYYDQGTEGACVGFGSSICMSYLNRRLYYAMWLYQQARTIDEWPGEDYDGTSVRAGMDVLRTVGHRRILNKVPQPAALAHGIRRNEWATDVDGVRTAIYSSVPVVLGINWYANFSDPVNKSGRYWIGNGSLGRVLGGHCICVSGASDALQAVSLTNSWGLDYPARVWLPYTTLQRMLNENGEAAVVVDRI